MAVGRLKRFDEPFGIKAPPLDVGAIERKQDAGIRHTLFDDRCKLELVSRPRFMGSQSPRRGRETEVVKRLHLSRLVGHVEGQDKFANFAGVTQQARRACSAPAWPRFRLRSPSGCAPRVPAR